MRYHLNTKSQDVLIEMVGQSVGKGYLYMETDKFYVSSLEI